MYNLSIQERLDIIEHKLKFISEELKPSVLLIQSLNPLVVKADVGMENICRRAGGSFDNNDFVISSGESNPDIILISSDLSMQEMFREIVSFFNEGRWIETPAVKNNRIYILDNFNQFSNGMDDGDHVVPVEIMAEILYPEYFAFGYEGDRWLKFELESGG